MNKAQSTSRAESLRRFDRLGEIPTDQLIEICDKAEWLNVKKKALLIDLGSDEASTIFLLKGNVLLEATDGRKKIIQHPDQAANSPISRLRPSTYKVTALTPVSYLKIDNALLKGIYESDEPSTLLATQYEVSESSEEESDSHAQLLMHIYEDLNHDRLKILSWYPVSRQIANQALGEKKDIRRLTQYVMLDPTLLLKIIRASTRVDDKATSLAGEEAISRLGIAAVHKLIFLNLFSESVHTRDDIFRNAYLAAWERSITVSAVSKLLALNKHHHNPDYISLAGLLHNIGELVLISYSYGFPAPMAREDLDDCIRLYAAEVGKVILSHWKMPHKLTEAVTQSRNWLRNNYTHTDDTDFILLALAYTELARKEHNHAPKISEMPAYKKMGLDALNDNVHQKLKATAAATVEETLSFLSATKL